MIYMYTSQTGTLSQSFRATWLAWLPLAGPRRVIVEVARPLVRHPERRPNGPSHLTVRLHGALLLLAW